MGVLEGLYLANQLAGVALEMLEKVDRGEMTMDEANAAFAAQAVTIEKEGKRFLDLTQ